MFTSVLRYKTEAQYYLKYKISDLIFYTYHKKPKIMDIGLLSSITTQPGWWCYIKQNFVPGLGSPFARPGASSGLLQHDQQCIQSQTFQEKQKLKKHFQILQKRKWVKFCFGFSRSEEQKEKKMLWEKKEGRFDSK